MGEFAYPRDEFWKIASEYPSLKVVIGVDAHKPEQLKAKEINMAYEFAKRHNIKIEEVVKNVIPEYLYKDLAYIANSYFVENMRQYVVMAFEKEGLIKPINEKRFVYNMFYWERKSVWICKCI